MKNLAPNIYFRTVYGSQIKILTPL